MRPRWDQRHEIQVRSRWEHSLKVQVRRRWQEDSPVTGEAQVEPESPGTEEDKVRTRVTRIRSLQVGIEYLCPDDAKVGARVTRTNETQMENIH